MVMNVLAVTLPTLTVLAGILLNQNGLNRLEARLGSIEGRLDGRMTALEASMNSLRGEMGALRMSFHSDVVMLLERDSKLESRVARLERVS